MLSTCCVQHVAAGGLNRVTAEACFLSLFWFYLWGKHRYTVEAQMSQFYDCKIVLYAAKCCCLLIYLNHVNKVHSAKKRNGLENEANTFQYSFNCSASVQWEEVHTDLIPALCHVGLLLWIIHSCNPDTYSLHKNVLHTVCTRASAQRPSQPRWLPTSAEVPSNEA